MSNHIPHNDLFAATVGFFDGVHCGHRHLLAQLCREAARRNLKTMAVTFARHPRQVLQPGWQPQLLTTTERKVELLRQAGMDRVEVLTFDTSLAQLTARQFMSQVLADRYGVRLLLTGHDNRFGHNRTETFVDYVRYGQDLGMEVVEGTPLTLGDITVSSSHIRQLLAEGKVTEAAHCLGYRYTLCGHVVHGEQIGRTLGFPTANLQPDDDALLVPREGVYAVTVCLDGQPSLPGMMNIGTRPTFNGSRRTLEINILAPCGDLYGQHLRVDFVARLRDEQTFASPEALAAQIARDREAAEQILKEKQI